MQLINFALKASASAVTSIQDIYQELMNPSEVWLVWPKMFFAPDSELDVTSTMIDLQTIRDNLITLSLIVLIPLTQLISLIRVSWSEVLHTKQYWEVYPDQ